MVEWIKNNTGYNKILVTLFVGLISFLALQVYNKVDVMPDKFVRVERYVSDQKQTKDQYSTDQARMERAVAEIQKDVKEILRALK